MRLSGLLHCEERVAFQEVARQLCSEFQQLFSAKATYDENLGFLRAMLASLHTCMKSVVFVLDDFERFARASAAPALSGTGTGGGRTGASAVAGGRAGRQMLLYNLLDVLQHSKVQAAVIGLTVAQVCGVVAVVGVWNGRCVGGRGCRCCLCADRSCCWWRW